MRTLDIKANKKVRRGLSHWSHVRNVQSSYCTNVRQSVQSGSSAPSIIVEWIENWAKDIFYLCLYSCRVSSDSLLTYQRQRSGPMYVSLSIAPAVSYITVKTSIKGNMSIIEGQADIQSNNSCMLHRWLQLIDMRIRVFISLQLQIPEIRLPHQFKILLLIPISIIPW